MRILYITRHFSESGHAILERLLAEGSMVVAVVLHRTPDPWREPLRGAWRRALYRLKCAWYRCRPLRMVGRTDRLARSHGIPILWTESVKSDGFYADVARLAPDLILLGGGWHEVLPPRIFSLPRLGTYNTHPSLLPAFRGTSITRWQVLRGVRVSGSTVHCVDAGIDTGGIVAQQAVDVPPDTTPQELFQLLGRTGADLLVPFLRRVEREGRPPVITGQGDPAFATYHKRWKWSLDTLRIDWSQPFAEIHQFVLANTQESYEYWGPHFTWQGSDHLLRRTRLMPAPSPVPAKAGLHVARIGGGEVMLARAGDPHTLVLMQVQRFDRWYKWRRAGRAAHRLRVAAGAGFPDPASQSRSSQPQ